MKPSPLVAWSKAGRRQVAAIGLAPLLPCLVTIVTLNSYLPGSYPLWFSVVPPFAYFTLFFGVFPMLIFLRRRGIRAAYAVPFAAFSGTLLFWTVLSFLMSTSGTFLGIPSAAGPPPGEIASFFAIFLPVIELAAIAALTGALVWWFAFRHDRRASSPDA